MIHLALIPTEAGKARDVSERGVYAASTSNLRDVLECTEIYALATLKRAEARAPIADIRLAP